MKSGIMKVSLKFSDDPFVRVIYLYFRAASDQVVIFDPTQCHVYGIKESYIYNLDTIQKLATTVELFKVQVGTFLESTDDNAFVEDFTGFTVY